MHWLTITIVFEILKILAPNGSPISRQRRLSPCVYLDTWALRLFAEQKGLGDRFRNALTWRHGTLALSALSFVEFARFEDSRHAESVGIYIDSLLPYLFIQDFEPFRVIQREAALGEAGDRSAPDGDVELFAEIARLSSLGYGPLTLRPTFARIGELRSRFDPKLDAMAAGTIEGIRQLRQRIDSEPEFRKEFRDTLKTASRPRSTLALSRALVADMQGDRARTPTVNDAIDFMHSAVPGAYCDFVLLDRAWHARIVTARRRLDRAGIRARVARSFSQRNDGVERFLGALESWRADQ